ncbi:spore cortex biosynthesis protein YabQ [Paenibacillus hexagrammi]|uniref:Spore cortex biosynthesis protein YabQ n=1 Tax=Paenibacillus hexagrammi TaxID=2908839 RepID=A0ABY3SIR6_9BACL|nr:spore cortex biosynthesis protein YabQ [Paenibacillus sp. YPD9-1]UJF33111.1 spore cortex biosynthesis protein YabQ [Paenibacillus sp. YPD9-1]
MTLHVQFYTLLMMFLSGAAMGTMYDVLRVLSGKLRLPRWSIPITDGLYWIVATILVFRLLMHSNDGQIRIFVFLGMGIGICFYFAFLSTWVIRLTLLLIKTVIALYRFLYRTVEILLIKPIIALYKLVLIILGFLAAVAIFLYKIVLQLLYPMWRLFLWMTRPVRKWFVIPAWLKRLWDKTKAIFRRLFSK